MVSAQVPLTFATAIRELRAAASTLRFEAGTHIFIRGTAATAVYLLEDGLVKLMCESEDGREFVLDFCGHGSLLGAAQNLVHRPFASSAVAIERVTAYQILRKDFLSLVRESKAVSAYVLSCTASQLDAQTAATADLALSCAGDRLTRMMRRVASIRRRPGSNKDPLLKDIAAALAITPTHLSRLLRTVEHVTSPRTLPRPRR